jgi:hypothetical protein
MSGFLAALLVVCAVVFGLALGFALPLRWFGELAGFTPGVFLGALVTLMAGMLSATLLGGWCEGLLGTSAGVPVGVAAGSFLGSGIINCVVGFAGVIGLRSFHLLASFFHGGPRPY